MEFDIDFIREMIYKHNVHLTDHFIHRIKLRKISIFDVKNCIQYGEIIESYPEDKPDPSCLIFGLDINGKFLHVVVAANTDNITLITSYYPNNNTFEDDFKTRKR